MSAKLKSFLLNLLYTVICLAISFLIVIFIAQRIVVVGNSMYPTLHDGDNLFVNKIIYTVSEPERFDVIVFPYDNQKHYIKRIIGLPGESVYIDNNGSIFIDGKALKENYGYEVIKDAGAAGYVLQLADDEYFVLGDNRNNSSDSRDLAVGNIKRSKITGKVSFRIWPFNKIGKIR